MPGIQTRGDTQLRCVDCGHSLLRHTLRGGRFNPVLSLPNPFLGWGKAAALLRTLGCRPTATYPVLTGKGNRQILAGTRRNNAPHGGNQGRTERDDQRQQDATPQPPRSKSSSTKPHLNSSAPDHTRDCETCGSLSTKGSLRDVLTVFNKPSSKQSQTARGPRKGLARILRVMVCERRHTPCPGPRPNLTG